MSGVLVLDVTYTPESIISFKDAVLLLLSGKAVPVSDETVKVMRSQRTSIEIPAVIQLAGVVASWVYQYSEPMCTHKAVMARDRAECQFVVGGRPCSVRATTIDHIVPQCQGGKDTWTNLIASCKQHNHFKADKTMKEMAEKFDWALREPPLAPKRSLRLLERAGVSAPHPAWVPFLA